jgi:RNA polymerase sigma-70 factor, ECF subfamily
MAATRESAGGLLRSALNADERQAEFTTLFECHREQLQRMVRRRIDPRLQGRFDESDVLQETYLEAAARFAEYRAHPTMPADRWLRFLAHQKLMELARRHLTVAARSVRREAAGAETAAGTAASDELADALLGSLTTPSGAAIRDETRELVRAALDDMDPIDRQVLALRHFEQLSHHETARALSLSLAAASKRYVRALRRLRGLLEGADSPDGGTA